MTILGKDDIAPMLADLGQTVVFGGASTKGLIDRVTTAAVAGVATNVLGRRITIIIETGALPGIAVGSTISINTTTYTVTAIDLLNEGGLTTLHAEQPS